ncbi:hypothetical protein OROGR_032948 [Orobanche gracilis]
MFARMPHKYSISKIMINPVIDSCGGTYDEDSIPDLSEDEELIPNNAVRRLIEKRQRNILGGGEYGNVLDEEQWLLLKVEEYLILWCKSYASGVLEEISF